jgi:Fe-S cluster biogenesis protein NfuA
MITEKPAVSSTDQVLKQIEKVAEKKFLPIVGPHKGKILAEQVRKAKPQATKLISPFYLTQI